MTDRADLTGISGVGSSRSETLANGGFLTVEEVAEADPGELDEILGAMADGESIRDAAREELESDDSDEEPREKTETVVFSNRDVALYAVKGLIDEALRLHGRNNYDEAKEVKDLTERVLNNVEETGGGIEVNLDDLSSLYTAVRNIEQELQGTRGISDLTGEMRDLRMDVQEARKSLWPDS